MTGLTFAPEHSGIQRAMVACGDNVPGTFLKCANAVFAVDGSVTPVVPSGHQPKGLVLLWVHEKISGEKNPVARTFLEVLHQRPSQGREG